MKFAQRMIIIVSIMITNIGCDQVTKEIAKQTLRGSGSIRMLNDIFRLQYSENQGGFLSLGANIPDSVRFWIFTLLVGFFLIGLLLYLVRGKDLSRNQIIALSLVLSGGLGNLIDRIVYDGRVIDFMNLGIGSLRTGIFNVADLAITGGVIWLLFLPIRRAGPPSSSSELPIESPARQ